jgi:hypothetical protein
MAATRLILGVLREVWQETVAQGPGAQVVSTGIRITASQLCRVQGLLTVVTPTGSPIFTAVPSIVNKKLVVTVTNTAAGGNLGTWTLDVRLVQSSDQANQGATAHSLGTTGYIQVANGATSGLAGTQTLHQTYNYGASAADQTMVLDTVAKGGGIIVDGSTAAMTTGYSLEVKQNALHDVPFAVSRRINQVPGASLVVDKARGTYALPLDVQVADELGAIEFVGRLGGVGAIKTRISSFCASVAAGGAFSLNLQASDTGAMSSPYTMQVASENGGDAVVTLNGAWATFWPISDSIGQLGGLGHTWAQLFVNTANVYANVCLGGATPGVNAFQTVVLPVAATMPPVASVGLVHIYAQDFIGTPCSPPFGAALAWSSEAAVQNATQVANRLVPVVVNGEQLLLLAINLNPA